MRKLGEVRIGKTKLVVRELTVAQVDSCLAGNDQVRETTTLDWLFGDDYMPQEILERIIERPVKEIMADNPDMAPSELEPLYKEALRINPFLGKALTRMRKIADHMMRMDLAKLFPGSAAALSTSSTEDSAESGSTVSPSSLKQSTN